MPKGRHPIANDTKKVAAFWQRQPSSAVAGFELTFNYTDQYRSPGTLNGLITFEAGATGAGGVGTGPAEEP